MKFLGLVEQDLDIVSKKYVDDKIASIPSGGNGESEAVKDKIKINLMTIYLAFASFSKYGDAIPSDKAYEMTVYDFIKYSFDKNGTKISSKYSLDNYNNNPNKMMRDILKNDPFIYFDEQGFNEMIFIVSYIFKKMNASIVLTQAEYDSLSQKNPDTIYFIKED
ncbi:MAG: phage upper tail fiber protein [Catonella sp.]